MEPDTTNWTAKDWHRYYTNCQKHSRRHLRWLYVKRFLFWRFMGQQARDDLLDDIGHTRYGMEETGDCLYKLEKYGPLRIPQWMTRGDSYSDDSGYDESGYDGFLSPEDQYRDDDPPNA